jgi:hypothetical protein
MRDIRKFPKILAPIVAICAAASGPAAAQTWTSPQVVGSVPYLTGGAVATNGNTSAVVFAAEVATDNMFEIQAVVRSGGSWGPRVALAPQFQFAEDFTVAVAPKGDALAAWCYDATMAADSGVAQVAFYTGGHWSAPVTISTTGLNAGMPAVAFDGQSQATIVWEQNATSTTCAVKAVRGNAGHGLGAAQTASVHPRGAREIRFRLSTPLPSPTSLSSTDEEAVLDRMRTDACESDEPARFRKARSTHCRMI